jgi:quinol monooxygenase YgiN
MYGAELTVVPGGREEMIGILKDSTADMTGCFSSVAEDSTDENTIWITELWDSVTRHAASLSSPAVKKAVSRTKGIVSGFQKIAVTTPEREAELPTPL